MERTTKNCVSMTFGNGKNNEELCVNGPSPPVFLKNIPALFDSEDEIVFLRCGSCVPFPYSQQENFEKDHSICEEKTLKKRRNRRKVMDAKRRDPAFIKKWRKSSREKKKLLLLSSSSSSSSSDC
jgi:hypothetical protein